MKEMADELATAGTHADLVQHLQIDDQRTEDLALLMGDVSEPCTVICGA
jgi:hypothetical protein